MKILENEWLSSEEAHGKRFRVAKYQPEEGEGEEENHKGITGSGGDDEGRDSGGSSYPPAICVGLYGWRRRSLFMTLIFLLLLVMLNLGLTLWMLKVMEFSAVSTKTTYMHGKFSTQLFISYLLPFSMQPTHYFIRCTH